MGPIGSHETSVTNCQSTLCNISEERRSVSIFIFLLTWGGTHYVTRNIGKFLQDHTESHVIIILTVIATPHDAVGIGTLLRAGRSAVWFPVVAKDSLFQSLHAESVAHPASCSLGSGAKAAEERSWPLTTMYCGYERVELCLRSSTRLHGVQRDSITSSLFKSLRLHTVQI